MKKALSVLLAVFAFCAASVTVYATGWQENGQYELADGSYAKGLVSIGGIKYLFDNDGILAGEYTGWTKNTSTGARNYYKNGKRQAGWRNINGNRYYFYYEGGAATGDVQIEDKIYTFEENGVFTGKTAEPVVYAKNLREPIYAEDIPQQIHLPIFYSSENISYFMFGFGAEGAEVEKYSDGKWERLERQCEEGTGFALVPHGQMICDGDCPQLFEDSADIVTEYYEGRLSPGKYRGVIPIMYFPDGNEQGKERYDGFIYSYFTIE